MIKIPKKYEPFIESVEKDDEGYWAYSQTGYMFPSMGCHTAHEYSKAELLKIIRTVVECSCKHCKEERAANE